MPRRGARSTSIGAAIRAGAPANGDLLARARELLAELEQPSLRRVVNATGVILHTNLGRAPLPASARRRSREPPMGTRTSSSTSTTGERGSRHAHVERLLCDLTGAEAAIVVNNGAGAVLLAAAAIAGPGKAIVVARGQLVEIGGGFRIPEVIVQSGARLVEVGTTNRTRIGDYARALETHDDVGAIMRVHQSNFRTVGFVEEVPIEALCKLAVPVIDDVGSGWLAGQPGETDGTLTATEEPPLTASVAAGAALVCCSGDKLLGGPQAGLIVGRRDAVARPRAGIPWPGRCASTSSRWPRSRRRCGCTSTPTARASRSRCWRCWRPTRTRWPRGPGGWRRRSATAPA